jgi:mono/diheme cytochrome c family protein
VRAEYAIGAAGPSDPALQWPPIRSKPYMMEAFPFGSGQRRCVQAAESIGLQYGGKRLAGGLPIGSPLGTIYSTNITPSKQYGIGNYSLQQFSDALRRGIRGDGAHLYPAMPYASYALLTDRDVKALYAYFTKTVPSVDEPPAKTTSLPFPYNLRFSMAFWNALFVNAKPFTPDPSKSAEWNRGQYLAKGAAHCGECHTPRGFFMQQDRGREFAGAVLGSWYAPNITPDASAGIGAMSPDELFHYLKFGKVSGQAQAGGEMGLAVQLSFSKLSDEDLKAIVTYVRSVPAIGDAEAKPKFAQGQSFTEVAKFRGVDGTSSDNALPGGVAELFAANCRAVTASGRKARATVIFRACFITPRSQRAAAAILLPRSCSASTAPRVTVLPSCQASAAKRPTSPASATKRWRSWPIISCSTMETRLTPSRHNWCKKSAPDKHPRHCWRPWSSSENGWPAPY